MNIMLLVSFALKTDLPFKHFKLRSDRCNTTNRITPKSRAFSVSQKHHALPGLFGTNGKNR